MEGRESPRMELNQMVRKIECTGVVDRLGKPDKPSFSMGGLKYEAYFKVPKEVQDQLAVGDIVVVKAAWSEFDGKVRPGEIERLVKIGPDGKPFNLIGGKVAA